MLFLDVLAYANVHLPPTKETTTSGKHSFKTPENNTVETRQLEDAHLRGKPVAGNVCLFTCNCSSIRCMNVCRSV